MEFFISSSSKMVVFIEGKLTPQFFMFMSKFYAEFSSSFLQVIQFHCEDCIMINAVRHLQNDFESNIVNLHFIFHFSLGEREVPYTAIELED